MKEKKDFLDQTIKEDLENEAQKIREMLAEFDGRELSDEKKTEMKEELHKKIDEYEVQKVIEQLPKKYQDAMKVGLKAMDEDAEFSEELAVDIEHEQGKKKVVYKKKQRKVYLALAAALILAMAIGVNSFGGPDRVLEVVKRAVGDREVVKVNSDEDNLILEAESEEEAYQMIKDELGIEPVKMIHRPVEVDFVSAEIDKDGQLATLYYQCNGETMVYIVNTVNMQGSLGIDIEDKVTKEFYNQVKDVNVEIREYETPTTKINRYSARFTHQDTEYFLMATMPEGEFVEIINNLHFFS